MVKVENGEIKITRGDAGVISVNATDDNGNDYVFQAGDVVRFKVFKNKDCGCVELQKDVTVEEETTEVDINLKKEDTKIGELISKPTVYWYEVELNPETDPQTIIGYDENGAKTFTLFPEGGDLE